VEVPLFAHPLTSLSAVAVDMGQFGRSGRLRGSGPGFAAVQAPLSSRDGGLAFSDLETGAYVPDLTGDGKKKPLDDNPGAFLDPASLQALKPCLKLFPFRHVDSRVAVEGGTLPCGCLRGR
jgi:hypothetical protein